MGSTRCERTETPDYLEDYPSAWASVEPSKKGAMSQSYSKCKDAVLVCKIRSSI